MEHSTQLAWQWFSTEGFMPHGHCYLWTPELLWTFVISESVIVLAYFSIPFALLYFVRKRKDLQFNWMFKLFSVFIFACGTTHLFGIWTIWYPDYWLDALVNVFTAIVSLVAAILIWPMIPRALKLPSTTQLAEAVAELQQEVTQRKAAEIELAHMKETSDARLHVLFDQAAAGVAEVDFNTGKFLLVNQKFCDLVGYSREEMLQRDYMSITYPDDLPISQAQLRVLHEGRISEYTLDKRYQHKDGHIVWVSLTVSLLRKPNETQPTLSVMVQDITARKRADSEVKTQLDELRHWHTVMLDRENRVQQLKDEVNELLIAAGQAPRYSNNQ
jgi:PAS domain S-box-containing protein